MHTGGYRQVGLTRAPGVFLVALVLTAGGVAATPYHFRGEMVWTVLFYALMDVLIPLGLLASGVYIARSDLSMADIRTVTAWLLGGVLVTWTLFLWSRVDDIAAGTAFASIQADLFLFGNFGGALGIVAGMNRARAAQNHRLVERTRTQGEALEFVNHLLRHNVLNGLQVIEGYASFLDEHVDEQGEGYLGHLHERTDHMTDLVDDVRVLMRTLSADDERFTIDCSTVLDREVSVARSAHAEATFETAIEPGLEVVANAALGAVFENLLANAVKHHDGDAPHVRVSATREAGDVVVRVADDGPGIPDDRKERYFEQGLQGPASTGDGLGLYLVATLVEAFDGSCAVRDNRPRGTVFELRMPAV